MNITNDSIFFRAYFYIKKCYSINFFNQIIFKSIFKKLKETEAGRF